MSAWYGKGYHTDGSQSGSHRDSVILVSSNNELASALRGVIHNVLSGIDKLPECNDVKGIILDASLALAVDISWIRREFPTSFIAVFDPSSSEKPAFRFRCFEAGVNMVAHDIESLVHTLQEAVIPGGTTGGLLRCPYCHLDNLSERELWFHCPAYHVNFPEDVHVASVCPICRKPEHGSLQVHIHEAHNPLHSGEGHPVKLPTILYNFSLVFCRHPETGKFLLCQEFANQGFWCPGGAVDAGETFKAAATRETMEEAGIEVELKGILSIEYNTAGFDSRNRKHSVRMRVIFYAEPSARGLRQLPKSRPDFESVGACWCSLEEIIGDQFRLRGSEPKRWCRYIAEGGAICPLSILNEGFGH